MLSPRALLALVPLLAIACGDAEPVAPEAPLAVLGRGLSWERRGEEPAPLTLAWSATDGLEQWTTPDGSVSEATGAPLRLDSPTGIPFDPGLHHWLTVRGQTSTPLTLRVSWRSTGESFADERASAAMALPASAEPQTWSLPLNSLRAAREASDVSEGVDQFRLVFQAPVDGEPAAVTLDSIVLSSDFDVAPGGPLPHHRLSIQGVLRDGVALRAPGAIVAEVSPGPNDRLRLALAVAGCADPVDVTIRDEDGELEPTTVRCVPGADWLDVALDLAPLRGRPARLVLEATHAPTPLTTILVGGVLRLGSDGRDLPDVVFYVEDTLRADHLATYGYPLDTDPHLQRIAQAGAVFEQTFAASSWTRPSVSTLHTSLDPIAHGNLTARDKVADPVDTLAESLAAAGYLTASFVTNYHGGGWSGLDQGFDEAHEPTAHGSTRVTSTLTSAVVADPVAAFLAAHEGERVFVFVHSLDPHAPYEPPGADHYALVRAAPPSPDDPVERERADLALRYDAEILHNDRYLQQLDATLAETGRASRTLFVFASDHGEAFGEHDQMEHRKTLHQEELHVPWVLRWPGVVAPGRRIDRWVGHIDMAPTLLGLLELEAPEGWRGLDLSMLLRTGEPPATAPSEVRPLLVHMVHEDEQSQSIAMLRAPYKLIMPLDATGMPTGPAQLLDLLADPSEQDALDAEGTHSAAADALELWARGMLAESRASSVHEEADAMSPEMRDWMREMGYLK